MTNPNSTQELINTFLKHMITLLAAITYIRTRKGSMDQTKMNTLIASIKGTVPVPKVPPLDARNPGQLDANSIVGYGRSVVDKRYRYATPALSLTKFDHTTGKVLKITMSLAERSNNSGWGSGTGSIT